MTMIGAQLDDLAVLADRLRTTTSDIGGGAGNAARISDNVVSSVREAARAAHLQIVDTMQALRVAVGSATEQAHGTTWTGANRDRFVDAAEGFEAAMIQAEQATTDTFGRFEAAVESMAAELESYSSQFGAAMADAQVSSASMASAVDAQRDNLDAVMNQGLSVG